MAFHEIQFPTDISHGATGGPEYSTDIVVLHSGYEQRNLNWNAARARYNVAQGVRGQSQLAMLIAFFRARKGRAHGFRFKDWSDYQGIAQSVGTGTGALTSFALKKNYISGPATESRLITKPVSGSVKIYVNAVLQTSGVSVDTTTGIITFISAPANAAAITADFDFDVPVRFDTDRLSASLEDYGASSRKDVPIVEVRV